MNVCRRQGENLTEGHATRAMTIPNCTDHSGSKYWHVLASPPCVLWCWQTALDGGLEHVTSAYTLSSRILCYICWKLRSGSIFFPCDISLLGQCLVSREGTQRDDIVTNLQLITGSSLHLSLHTSVVYAMWIPMRLLHGFPLNFLTPRKVYTTILHKAFC